MSGQNAGKAGDERATSGQNAGKAGKQELHQ
jgi:hypothetical protein